MSGPCSALSPGLLVPVSMVNLTELCLPFLSVPLPADDHPSGSYGPWVAQKDCERVQHRSRICRTCHCPRANSGCERDHSHHRGLHIWSRTTYGHFRYVSPKAYERSWCCVPCLACFDTHTPSVCLPQIHCIPTGLPFLPLPPLTTISERQAAQSNCDGRDAGSS